MIIKVATTLLIIWIVPVLIINTGHFITQTFKKIKELLKSTIFEKKNTKSKKGEFMTKIKTFETKKPEPYIPAFRNLKKHGTYPKEGTHPKEGTYPKQGNTIYTKTNGEKFRTLFNERMGWFDLV